MGSGASRCARTSRTTAAIPRTGQPVPVPAKRLPFFKVGKELKELVNSSRHTAIKGGDDDDDDDTDDDTDDAG